MQAIVLILLAAAGGWLGALGVWHGALMLFGRNEWVLALAGPIAAFAGFAGMVLAPWAASLVWEQFRVRVLRQTPE